MPLSSYSWCMPAQNGENCCTEFEIAAYEAAFLADRQTVVPNARKRQWQRWTASGGQGSAMTAVEQPIEGAEYTTSTVSGAAVEGLTGTAAAAVDGAVASEEFSDAAQGHLAQPIDEPTAERTVASKEAPHWRRRLTSWSVRT